MIKERIFWWSIKRKEKVEGELVGDMWLRWNGDENVEKFPFILFR